MPNASFIINNINYVSLIYSYTKQQEEQKAFGVLMRTMNNYNCSYDYEEEAAASGSGSGCLRFFCFDGRRWDPLQGGEHKVEEETWFVKKMKDVKEFSEVVAGPKWKNFIRKIGKYCNTKKSRMAECRQYDPQSYALNFDDGAVDDFEEDSSLLIRGFSSNFAPPPPPPVVSSHQLPGPSL